MLLDAIPLPSATPWWAAAIVACLLALLNTVGLVLVARAQKVPAKTDHEERLAAAETALKRIDAEERDDVAVVREGLASLKTDVEKRWKADDARRERAGKLAQDDREKIHEHLAGLRERVGEMAGTLRGMLEGRHGR